MIQSNNQLTLTYNENTLVSNLNDLIKRAFSLFEILSLLETYGIVRYDGDQIELKLIELQPFYRRNNFTWDNYMTRFCFMYGI